MSTLPTGDRRRRGRLSNFSIQAKLALAFGVLLLLFGATGLMYGYSVSEVRAARGWTEHSHESIRQVSSLATPLLRQQSAVRGYLVTFDPSFLDSYEENGAEFNEHWDELRKFVGDNPAQQGLLDRALAKTREWWAFQGSLIELSREAGSQLQIQERLVSGEGARLLAETQAILIEFQKNEQLLLVQRTQELDQSLDRTRNIALIMLIAGGLFVALVIYTVSGHIGQPMGRIGALMTRLAAGERIGEIPDQRRGDEVGAVARGLEQFRVANEELRGREWVKARVAQLSSALQQAHSTQEFAQALIGQLCEHSEAAYGAVFCMDEKAGALLLAGGYGMPGERFAMTRVVPGEGPIGQVARDRKPRVLRGLPRDYFPLRSATGQMPPQVLYLLPLMGRESLLGVVELALLTEPDSRIGQLFEEALKFAGVNFEALLQSLETMQLLRATQRQKEELEASEEALRGQEEELRATNEALREKQQQLQEQAQRLQASEEELRAQSEELRITNAHLEEKSLELTQQKSELEKAQAALESKAIDLEQASQYKSDFLANMSHELRTPLNSLLILAKGLADNEDGNLNDEQLESARIVYDSGKNLLGLINDILDLSKIEAGKMDAVPEDFDLQSFAMSFERNFRALARDRKLAFGVEVEPGLPPQLRSDPGKLSQIISNLLSNAFKFTHEGSISLRIARPRPGMTLPAGLRAEGCVAFTVRDSGIGIPAEKLARLFQAFEQGDSGTSRRYGGTGLGLSICRGLAHLLGGEVSVESGAGQGSAFTLVLPQSGETAAAPGAAAAPPISASDAGLPAPPARAAPPSTGESEAFEADGTPAMLIVEDDRQFAEVLAGMSRSKGYRVLVAHDGESALRLAARHPLAGVLLDIGLPGMDGWQVMEWLKENPRTQRVPVHFISGADDGGRAEAMGAAGFLRKPVTQAQIAGVLDALPEGKYNLRRILLIDDSIKERRVVRELLRGERVQIDECARAEEGLERLAAQSYDLIILDLGLPGMDGFEFLEIASKRGGMPPVVVHSGRELSREESMKLREYTDSVVLKNAPTTRRLLDEVTLFLHSIRRVGTTVEPAPEKPAPPRELSGKTALIVDDDMRNMFALSKALRSHGLKVMMAQDGPKALAQLESSPEIAIVLMDIMMPGMDGYEVMQKIRAQPKWQKLPMIAVTAKAMTGDREKCIAAGANDYCTKPIDVEQLIEQMRQLLAAAAA